ncbi:MAG: DUF3817 domain-containing protein [Flavobacteriaceae bacterium]|nr:DUF3817 domain-containing protein [Flavobacteriaceae bacterium]
MISYFQKMDKEKLIRQFKWACIAEFITCILLYLIAMPLKYQFDILWPMFPIGSLHGAAFIWYSGLLYFVRKPLNWDDEDLVIAILAAFFPFATWYVEKYMMNQRADSTTDKAS